MGTSVLDMSMSLDGFVADPDGVPGPLHEWLGIGAEGAGGDAFHPGAGVNGRVFDEMLATRAVVAGAGTFEPAGGWSGDHHGGVPIFIYSRHEPRLDISGWPLVTYVQDVGTAIARAKDAAGDGDVLVHGAAVAQLALAAGVLDELELHLVPVLLGRGRRLFDGLPAEFERVRVLEGEQGVTHLHYRVRR